jgi:hypothetical protein
MPRLEGKILDRHVFDLRRLLHEELDDGVRVGREAGLRRGVLLDHAETALRLGDDQQAPEKRAAVGGADDPHVQRLLEHDAPRDVHEQTVLPLGRVVGGELLGIVHQLAQAWMLRQRLERDPFRGALDLDSGLGHHGDRRGGHIYKSG